MPRHRRSCIGVAIGPGCSTFTRMFWPQLARAPGIEPRLFGTLWLLTHGETRKTKRVRLFTDFVSRRLTDHAPRLAGLAVSRD